MFQSNDEVRAALHKCCEYSLFLQNVFTGHEIWKELDLEEYDERLMAVFGCLYLIRDTNYKTGDCFERDLQTGMYELLTKMMHKNVSFEDACYLTTHIVMEVLQNHAKPFKHSLTDLMNTSYINFFRKLNSEGVEKDSYHLEMVMEEYLFLISGIEKYVDIEIQQIIFNERISQKDYKNAVDDATSVYRGLIANTNYLKKELERQKRHSYGYDYQKYEQVIQKRKEIIQQTIDKFQGYKEKIKADMDQLGELEFQHFYQKLSPKQKENLAYQEEIQQILDHCLQLLSENYDTYSQYSQNIEQSLKEHLKLLFDDEEYFSFNDIYQTILSHGDSLLDGSFMEFMVPLFYKKEELIYNPELALNEVYSHEKKEHLAFDNHDMFGKDSRQDEDEVERLIQLQEEKEEPYRQLFAVILEKLLATDELSFAELEVLLDTDKERNLFASHQLAFLDVIVKFLQLAMAGKVVDIELERKKYEQMLFITGSEVDLIKVMLEVIADDPEFAPIKRIRFETELDKMVDLFGFSFHNPILVLE